MKDDGRQRALAHVGIYSTAIAPDGWPWGDRIRYLVEDWEGTWWCTLTHQQKSVRVQYGRYRSITQCGIWQVYFGFWKRVEQQSRLGGLGFKLLVAT